jgi:hypothetical protein
MDDDHWYSIYQYYSESSIIITNKKAKSMPIQTSLGCKQGGPMSPKLFSIYVNDMIEEISKLDNICGIGDVKTGIILYADDTTVLCPTLSDLQLVLNKIESYCRSHEILINTKKTKYMIFGTKQQINVPQEISINNNKIDLVDKFKYLGVWLRPNLNNSEHLKQRKMIAIAAAYKLNSLGLNSNIVSAELKSFLLNVYCSTSLQYGIENSYMSETEYKEIESIEGRIIKRALGLTKYHSTSMIMNALDSNPAVSSIKIRKLSFQKQLTDNPITYKILAYQLNHAASLATKSFVRELVKITRVNIHDFNIRSINKICKNKIKNLKAEREREKSSKEAVAIRYLLDHRSEKNDDLLRRLTHWTDRPKKKTESTMR